ncbi:MAG: ROK family protein [Phycisphaerales bacterium]|nr:ROK family protein [Phycisphaerales bacterium]
MLLGVDGGATGIRCHEVRRTREGGPGSYRLGAASAELAYPRLPGFAPVSPKQQREDLDRASLTLSAIESEQARVWIDTAADVISRVVSATRASSVIIGIGMPGIKSDNERGIVMMNNGPRMPEFLDQLTDRLTTLGVTLERSIRRIGDDGAYAGLGEECAEGGLFRDVRNAYYIGGGTGIAECLKVDGIVVPMSGRSCAVPRAWELASPMGPTYESLISAAAMNAIYAKLSRSDDNPRHAYPEVAAAAGDPIALCWLQCVAMLLAHLVHERLVNLRKAPASATPDGLDRVIIGQRVGRIFADSHLRPLFADHVESALTHLILHRGSETSQDDLTAYLDGDGLRSGFLVASNLRAAPAIGAAVDADCGYSGSDNCVM